MMSQGKAVRSILRMLEYRAHKIPLLEEERSVLAVGMRSEVGALRRALVALEVPASEIPPAVPLPEWARGSV